MIDNLKVGQVLGLCRFPQTVTVQTKLGDGKVTVDADGLQVRDLVMLLPKTPQPDKPRLFVVAESNGKNVRLAGSVPEAEDRLAVANTRGVVHITGTANDKKVTISQPANAKPVRLGDFLSDEIGETSGWIQPLNNKSAIAAVTSVADSKLVLTSHIDGLLLNDTLGVASLTPNRMQVRLKEETTTPLKHNDEILILGTDRLSGESKSISAIVSNPPVSKQLILEPGPGADAFEFRPQDILASVLFVSGSPMRLIKDMDLYVSWLACGDSDQMPRECSKDSEPADACGKSKELII